MNVYFVNKNPYITITCQHRTYKDIQLVTTDNVFLPLSKRDKEFIFGQPVYKPVTRTGKVHKKEKFRKYKSKLRLVAA